ncbi:ChuX/HutX family heme-like substrate-binding protein, partial [Craterilacuibacter sp.]|uniref:ChuX/HutX family heme-like substrate-binding protein n=1 Tax=Craterilacuibacter sp. TaxID=2870909 RepID=UPI003F3C9899
ADEGIDLAAFHRDWLALADVHGFHSLLRRYGLSRQQAFRLAPAGQAWRVRADAVETLLRRVALTRVPMMAFAGNSGVIQIHTGLIDRVEVVGDWLNVLDPAFSLHLSMAKIAGAWVTHKPGECGGVTSLELFDDAGSSVLTLFGERKGGQAERVEWRKLLSELLPLEGEDA